MKFNFKKIVPILTGAILLGSTIGFATSVAGATAAYPSDFTDSVVVIGSASADSAAAALIASDLGKLKVGTATTMGGESVKIEGSSKLNIGSALTDVKTTVLTKSDMPTLLAKKSYQSKDGVSYDYEQEILIASGLTYGMFADIDYKDTVPTLGITKSSNSPILNYSIKFVKTVESDVDSTGRLEDIQDTQIEILGKSYKVLNAYNGTNLKLELMAGAASDILEENAKKDYVVSGKTYTVEASFIGSDKVKLIVNDERTTSIVSGGTYKLSDGTQVGVRDILYKSVAGIPSKVEFTLGAEKMTIENGQKLKLNDENVNDVMAFIGQGTSASKRTISSITFAWITNDKVFMTAEKEAVMPGTKGVKIVMTDLTAPTKEQILLTTSGDRTIQLRAPIKSGVATIPLLAINGTAITKIGGSILDAQSTLVTSNSSSLSFNRTTDRYFVASWASTTAAESYLLKVTSITKDSPSSGLNSTDIEDAISGTTVCDDKKALDTCTFGNIVLTISAVDPAGNGKITVTGGTGVSFNKLYTAEGLLINLPVDCSVAAELCTVNPKQYVNLSANAATWTLTMEEEDKNSNLGSGYDINATIGIASNKIEVGSLVNTGFSGGRYFDLGGSSTTSKYVAYLTSQLGSKLIYDSKPDQNTLEVEYHGGETYGNVWVAAPEVAAGAALVVEDVKVTADQKSKNIVVVGGPAINKLAAEVMGLTFPTYGTDPLSGFAKDMAIIRLYNDKLTIGKVALLVAGYEAKDTLAGAKALIAEKKFGTLQTATAEAKIVSE